MTRLPDVLRRSLGLPPEATAAAAGIDALHASVIGTALLGIGVIAALTLFFIVRYRRKPSDGPTPRIVASTLREWLTAVALFSLFLAFWSVGYVQYADIEQPPSGTPIVYVTAKQWMWQFTYPDGRSSEDTLVIPENTAIEVVMTSRDVIHSFFVPAFRIKQDAVPGRWVTLYIDKAKAGTYPIYCAEYCGVSHSNMLGEVRVLGAADYAEWRRQAPAVDLAVQGKSVAAKHGCFACHTIDGQRHIGPSFAGLYQSHRMLDDGREVFADEAYLTRSMMEPLRDRVLGFNPVMPSYRGQLSADEAGALVEMIRSLKDSPIQPKMALPSLTASLVDAGADAP